MHIKQITLSNFRSFKKQPEIHPFSATTNAIVGRNGSGKSNLFDAVQFVLLAPKFWTLRTVRDYLFRVGAILNYTIAQSVSLNESLSTSLQFFSNSSVYSCTLLTMTETLLQHNITHQFNSIHCFTGRPPSFTT